MRKISYLLFFCVLFSSTVIGQDVEGMMYLNEHRRPHYRENLIIPDVNGYQVLKCDFHMHTIFSDGLVWPTVRLQEVWEEGLDVMSLTEHVESHRYKGDVKTDKDRPYQLVKESALKNNVMLIRGAELTRRTPPGHFNAIFIGDMDGYITERRDNDFAHDKEAIMKAADQNAFIFWNHPGWRPNIEGSYEWLPLMEDLRKGGNLHGIEVINGFGFHLKALDWCVDKGLTVIANSDMHNLVKYLYDTDKDYVHRTMTLVMAKDRTPESVREALDAGRTVAWASKILAGKEEHVRDLFNACVKLMPSHYTEKQTDEENINYYELRNNSDLYFELSLTSGSGTKNIVLHPRSMQVITAKAGQSSLSYDVITAYVRSDKYLNVTFEL